MSNYQASLANLINLNARVYQERGNGWPNTANTDCVRGTFGVGQLIAEAIEQSERLRTTEDEVRIAFEIDGLISAICAAKPSKIRAAISNFADERNINIKMLETMIWECSRHNLAPITTVGGYRLHCVFGVSRNGRRVNQK